MKHVIMGTSGHIDHGKTALIKALTGFDTDTLEEEKRRGITINNGFTNLKLSEDLNVGIIDVPGHEKFVKNMVAGATSIDLVLFIIAADDGIMPQTREHFSILKTLGVKNGIIVLTKADLVDKDWIEFISEEVRDFVKDSFLKDSKIIPVSSKTMEGIEELKKAIYETVLKIEDKDREALFRMAIDRAFTVTGFGNVVTGTILGGRVSVSDELELYPSEIKCKVRGIQVHGKDRDFAEAGERAAINLTGVEKEDIKRGLILGEIERETTSYIIDCIVTSAEDREKPIKDRDRVRVHHGTREIIGRIVILDKDEISKGEKAYCQLRLEEQISSRNGDKIVLRSYSPLETIGGGVILEPNANKAKRFKEEYIKDLEVKEKGSIDKKIEWIIKNDNDIKFLNEIKSELNKEEEIIEKALEKLVASKKIIKVEDGYIHNRYLRDKIEELTNVLKEYEIKHPLNIGIKKEEIKSKIFNKKIKKIYFDNILNLMVERKVIKIINNHVSLYDFKIKLNLAQKNMERLIMSTYIEAGFKTPKFKEILDKEKDKKTCNEIFNYLKEKGDLIQLEEEVVYSLEYTVKAKEIVIEFLNKNKYINLSDLKELINVSRKYLVGILEYLDREGITKRTEEGRVLVK